MPKIKFTDTTGQVPKQFNPTPAKLEIPEWLKLLAPYTTQNEGDNKSKFAIFHNNQTNQTAKRCIPMLDAVMSGYIIKLSHDINVENSTDAPYYQWRHGLGVGFHDREQLSTHKMAERDNNIAKINNPWAIKTAPGYSCLFVPPLNSEDSAIIPFSGVVDTDQYFAPVNFPFRLKEGFSGIIEAGSPIVQVIPFKRDSWEMEIVSDNLSEITRIQASIQSIFRNAYRNMYWSKKSYS